jgi:hypothetical protein
MAEADNVLYYGDNLDVLRRHIADESADLAYLDPCGRCHPSRQTAPCAPRGVQPDCRTPPSACAAEPLDWLATCANSSRQRYY